MDKAFTFEQPTAEDIAASAEIEAPIENGPDSASDITVLDQENDKLSRLEQRGELRLFVFMDNTNAGIGREGEEVFRCVTETIREAGEAYRETKGKDPWNNPLIDCRVFKIDEDSDEMEEIA